MITPDRLDPLALPGSFAYLESDVPHGVHAARLASPARRRGGPKHEGGQRGGPRARGSRPAGAVVGESAARRADRARDEVPVSSLHLTELLAGQLAARRERREALRRLGRQGRLAAYRRGEFDLDSCCLWAAGYPHEVPLLNGEFEFIAINTPEVREP